MELASYADYAVRLVNSEEPERGTDALVSAEAIRALFSSRDSDGARLADESDLPRLRAVRARLRAVFEAAAADDEVRGVDLLNSLLVEYPVSPLVSGHDYLDESGRPRWHLHLADNAPTATANFTAVACMGLAIHLTELGADRLGICQAAPCRNAYLDTSTNRSRRYCSDRCATRANVAAYRARKRQEAAATAALTAQGEFAEDPEAGGQARHPGQRPAAEQPLQPAGRCQPDRPRPDPEQHPAEHQVGRHRAVLAAVVLDELIVRQQPPAARAALGGPLDHQQVLAQRVTDQHHRTGAHPGAVPNHHLVAVEQSRHHRGPGHVDHPERQQAAAVALHGLWPRVSLLPPLRRHRRPPPDLRSVRSTVQHRASGTGVRYRPVGAPSFALGPRPGREIRRSEG